MGALEGRKSSRLSRCDQKWGGGGRREGRRRGARDKREGERVELERGMPMPVCRPMAMAMAMAMPMAMAWGPGQGAR